MWERPEAATQAGVRVFGKSEGCGYSRQRCGVDGRGRHRPELRVVELGAALSPLGRPGCVSSCSGSEFGYLFS